MLLRNCSDRSQHSQSINVTSPQGFLSDGRTTMAVSANDSLHTAAEFAELVIAVKDGVPVHLRDGSYPGAGRLGHGKGYRYAHDAERGVAEQQYPPNALVGTDYYRPTDRGAERDIATRLARLRAIIRGNPGT